MAPVRVRRAADNHRQLRRAGPGGASAPRRQDGAGAEARTDRKLLPVHLHDRGRPQDRGPRAGAAHRLVPAQHLEHDGLFRGVHGARHVAPSSARCRSENVKVDSCVTTVEISFWSS
uniref:(northern house mosquito) hypothetical protein n=1 Tax=Culex pipiens TaxID=7175 RepID=A0A8D8EXT4_CULPI